MRNLVFLLLSIYIILNVISISAQAPLPTPSVKAQFKVTVNPNDTSVFIENKSSKNANTFVINFGDGTAILDKELLDHTYKYATLGKFNICLTATDTTGLKPVSDTYCNAVEFTQQIVDCAADFNYVTKGLTVTVKNISNGKFNKLIWNFGDGFMIKNSDTVSHIYKKSGSYDISLFVQKNDKGCQSMKVKTIAVVASNTGCAAGYDYFNDSARRIIFTNKSLGTDLIYQWNFGDGTMSNDSSPSHEYLFPGIYEVTLQVENNNHTAKSSYSSFIPVGAEEIDILPDFEALSDPETDTVEFKSISLGSNINSYIWNFGDGITSKDTAPVHVYQTPGDYNVCLSVVPKTGNAFNTRCKNISAGISQTYVPDFTFNKLENDSVSFVSQFSYNPDSLLWDFDDKTFSADTQPMHKFPGDGIFLVSLKLKYNSRIFENLQIVNTTSNPEKLICRYKYYFNESSHLKAGATTTKFKGRLSGDISRRIMYWDFGDGTKDSTTQEPEHSYDTDGTYEVCYTVYNYLTRDTDKYCDSVKIETISKIKPLAGQTVALSIYPNPAKDMISLQIYASRTDKAGIELYDFSGRKVTSLFNGNINPGLNKMSLRLNIRKGIYLLTFHNSTEIHSVKVLIE